jgi:hypothetical protein
MVSLKNSWNNVRTRANVRGRWRDNRDTLITDLAESGAGDETIRDIAGHVSRQVLKHYSHIRMEAKRRALESIVEKKTEPIQAEGKASYPVAEAHLGANSDAVSTKVTTGGRPN